ncbi:decapping nuclease KNAG_0I00210 [Huiozyma naganishii CBS 8797]|uniref:Decapping nuclease n=1 Tax=Huiozyma naganishii (strain ATCC MYA-139 / BCRC 22969 / CBS 8797 / KCTC 17520 / NBRC 10181 / NCYC 3082 / Yp74L-3) TaxID=1071383 RepID=J7S237_HUIN7|nr:hypothetical protein KNAG_0I00210 [Kazachstania naganishii CBS 8797]CCK71812.1 hypothetical protein KNAG_0I00210 [Kazachstania naganishii CBS 8797]
MAISSTLFINQKGSTTTLKQPKEVSFYSRTQGGECLVHDDSRLKYYYLPNADLDSHLDLSSGFKRFKNCERDFQDVGSIHPLLDTIMGYEETKSKPLSADIVGFSDTIIKIILSAFHNTKINPIDMRVVSYRGQLFIKNMASTGVHDPDMREYASYKFETLATLAEPLAYTDREILNRRPKKISNNGDKYYTLVKTGVASAKLVLASEVNCIFDFKQQGKDNLRHYCFLECSSAVNNINDSRRFENQFFRNWLKCFLVGIPRIICGFYDEKYIVKTVEEYSLDEVPLLLKEHSPEAANKCTNAIKWYGLFTEWLLKIIPRDKNDHSIRPFKLQLADNHLKLTEIDAADPEYIGIVEGEDILSSKFKVWRSSQAV